MCFFTPSPVVRWATANTSARAGISGSGDSGLDMVQKQDTEGRGRSRRAAGGVGDAGDQRIDKFEGLPPIIIGYGEMTAYRIGI